MKMKRTHRCGHLRMEHAGQRVVLSGWIENWRDQGGVVFVDLRDRWGKVQVVFRREDDEELQRLSQTLRSEWVISVSGTVDPRPEGSENPKLATGQVEISVDKMEILSRAKTTPFEITEHVEPAEEVRLRYRYLDLRRPRMQHMLQVRHRAIQAARQVLNDHGFLEIETPLLGRSTPEGARDYLVPSRVSPGHFYALPQSPQMYKQLLMVAGVDRYFQIAKCMRDEDLRADRQPEFTQVDIEMSFVDQDDVLEVTEEFIAAMFQAGVGRPLSRPFPRLTYQEAMDRYGSDKPDLRFDLELTDLTDAMRGCGFKVFADTVASGGIVKAMNASDWGDKSRREIEDLTHGIAAYGAKGLAWMKVTPRGLESSIVKFFSEQEQGAIREKMHATPGDLLLFVADTPKVANASLSFLRNQWGQERGRKDKDKFSPLWVTDFPLFQWDDALQRHVSEHHPFTAPADEDIACLDTDPGRVNSRAYDLVINGLECASGSIRIHDGQLQKKIFSILQLREEDIENKFGFFYEALQYGTPPHGGLASGVDRLIPLMLGLEENGLVSIREVIAFPKTQKAVDLMTGAPGLVSPRQLKDLGIATG